MLRDIRIQLALGMPAVQYHLMARSTLYSRQREVVAA